MNTRQIFFIIALALTLTIGTVAAAFDQNRSALTVSANEVSQIGSGDSATIFTTMNTEPEMLFLNVGMQQGLVQCNSVFHNRNTCVFNGRGAVRLYKRHSSSPCLRGRDWGVRGRRIWVDHGCRATFRVGR